MDGCVELRRQSVASVLVISNNIVLLNYISFAPYVLRHIFKRTAAAAAAAASPEFNRHRQLPLFLL